VLIHFEVSTGVRPKAIHLDETSAVQKNIETLAGKEFPLFVLAPGALFAAAALRTLIEVAQAL
jgi:hypothetical protein